MPERLLTQHFLQRFLENDLLSPDADRHDAIAMVCGVLLSFGLFLSVVISMQFVFMPFQTPARTAMLAMGDRLLFVTISMIVMALVAVLTWDALSLDPRDTAIFGPLPIKRGVIVRAKLRAVGILAGGFALAISSLSSIVHPSLMVAKLSIGVFEPLAMIVIHLAVTLSAGLFAFSTIVVVRELLRALLGVRFARVSAGLQAVMIIALITSFLLLPALMDRSRPDQRQPGLLPPLWFVGLHEALAGDLVANLPRGSLPVNVARQEDAAAARYRQIAPMLRPLAWRAVLGLAASLTIAIAAFFWNSRELPLPLVGNRAARSRGPGLLTHAITATLARRPAAQAGFFFTVQCVFRSGPHRVVMAGCTAVAIALATGFLAAASRSTISDPGSVPGYVFSTQTLALAVLLAGFRHATRLPADIRANRLFRLAWVTDGRQFLAGVRRAAVAATVLPAILALSAPYFFLLGPKLALMHAVSGFLLGAAVISVMTLKTSQLPFVAGYAPAADLNTKGPIVLIGGLISVSVFSGLERAALAEMRSTLVLWGVLAALAMLPRLAIGRGHRAAMPTAFDVPAAGATRLDLG